MARKQKRKAPARARTAARPPVAPRSPLPGTEQRPSQASRVGGEQTLVRAVEMSLGPRSQHRRGGRIVLDTGDPAIPLEHVPYFIPDLIRVGVVAVVMVGLLIGGSFLIPFVVH